VAGPLGAARFVIDGSAAGIRSIVPWLVLDREGLPIHRRGGNCSIDARRQREGERDARQANCERENREHR
jgi:hypothetical protein